VTPDEVLAFQEAQDTYRAANPETTPQPESLRTLVAQLDLVRAGSKPNMFFEGATRDQLPATMRPIAGRTGTIDGVDTPGGYVVFNKAAIRPFCGPAGSGLLHQLAGRRPPPLPAQRIQTGGRYPRRTQAHVQQNKYSKPRLVRDTEPIIKL
jgi:hypothetical protein